MRGLDAPEDRGLEKEEFLGAATLFSQCAVTRAPTASMTQVCEGEKSDP